MNQEKRNVIIIHSAALKAIEKSNAYTRLSSLFEEIVEEVKESPPYGRFKLSEQQANEFSRIVESLLDTKIYPYIKIKKEAPTYFLFSLKRAEAYQKSIDLKDICRAFIDITEVEFKTSSSPNLNSIMEQFLAYIPIALEKTLAVTAYSCGLERDRLLKQDQRIEQRALDLLMDYRKKHSWTHYSICTELESIMFYLKNKYRTELLEDLQELSELEKKTKGAGAYLMQEYIEMQDQDFTDAMHSIVSSISEKIRSSDFSLENTEGQNVFSKFIHYYKYYESMYALDRINFINFYGIVTFDNIYVKSLECECSESPQRPMAIKECKLLIKAYADDIIKNSSRRTKPSLKENSTLSDVVQYRYSLLCKELKKRLLERKSAKEVLLEFIEKLRRKQVVLFGCAVLALSIAFTCLLVYALYLHQSVRKDIVRLQTLFE